MFRAAFFVESVEFQLTTSDMRSNLNVSKRNTKRGEQVMRQQVTIEWWQDIHEEPKDGRTYGSRIGRKRMRATVLVEVDAEGLANALGKRAATSKGKKAVEASGKVVVKATGEPVELRREMSPTTASQP